MPIRYRLLPFDQTQISTPQAVLSLLTDLGGFRHSPLANLSTKQWLSTLEHALSAGAKSILLQEAVRDPDFVEEYEAFYSKQQKSVSNLCRRLHFFAVAAPATAPTLEPADVLAFVDAAAKDDYVGFVTLRPLRHAPVGASILKHLPQAPVTCKDEFPVHIAGCEFSVSGTPYLQQDNAVGACAQASIWVALRTLRKRLGNSAYSPAELTVAATKHFTFNRVFPGRDGLTPQQMLEAIRSAGHDPLIIDLRNQKATPDERAVEASKAAAPYLDSGLPVILGLDNPTGGHAVVAIGFGPSAMGNVYPDVLTIHNDNSGCYLSLPLMPPAPNAYALSETIALIMPLPDGISMTAAEAETLANAAISFASPFLLAMPPIKMILEEGKAEPVNFVLRVFLSTRHSFRSWATEANDIDVATKNTYRTAELPRFVWIAEIHDQSVFQRGGFANRSRLGEVILDASADASHGDGLLFVRLSGLLVGGEASDDGILVIERSEATREILAIKTPACLGQQEPWK